VCTVKAAARLVLTIGVGAAAIAAQPPGHATARTPGSAAVQHASPARPGNLPADTARAAPAKVVATLVAAYPDEVHAVGNAAVSLRDGTTIPVDRERAAASFDDLLSHADLTDQLSMPYSSDCPVRTPTENDDPGRLRDDAFFSTMYGRSTREVSRHLRPVAWFGQTLQVTSVNGVDRQLAAVAAEFAALPGAKRLRAYLTPSAGTFAWRAIAGTSTRSAHSYGIAIDLNTRYSDYWRWDGASKPPVYRNRIPCEIATVFERHGFIWGARWYHYDTMHFEYRPELLG
jgi:D-alanyl-D-alanine carboxypeptidase